MEEIQKSITVERDVETVYKVWDDVKNIPKFMKQIKSVEPQNNDKMHWTVEGPFSTTIEWDAKIVEKKEPEIISWKSTGGDIENQGTVSFQSLGPEETRVELDLQYEPKTGVALSIFHSLFGNPEKHVEYSLHKFKQYVEERMN